MSIIRMHLGVAWLIVLVVSFYSMDWSSSAATIVVIRASEIFTLIFLRRLDRCERWRPGCDRLRSYQGLWHADPEIRRLPNPHKYTIIGRKDETKAIRNDIDSGHGQNTIRIVGQIYSKGSYNKSCRPWLKCIFTTLRIKSTYVRKCFYFLSIAGFSMFAEHMGMGMAAKATKNMGFDITGLAKNMGVGGLTAVLKPFVKDDHMLTFIDGFLSTVLNSNTATQVEKLTVLLRGYLMVSVPYRNVQPHFQQDVFDCCVGKLVGVYAKENNVEATAVATMEVLEGFEMEIGNHSPKHQQQHKNL